MLATGGRQGEDHVVVGDRQQLARYAGGQPVPAPCRPLALGAVTVAAGVVGDVLMVAFGAGSDMPAKRCGPASLDGRHHLQLRQVQVSGVVPATGSTMGTEDIRDLQFGAGHRSRGLPGPSLPAHQQIKRACHTLDRLGCHLGVNRRRFQLGMAKQDLDHPDVGSAFEQMRGKAMPQGVG